MIGVKDMCISSIGKQMFVIVIRIKCGLPWKIGPPKITRLLNSETQLQFPGYDHPGNRHSGLGSHDIFLRKHQQDSISEKC